MMKPRHVDGAFTGTSRLAGRESQGSAPRLFVLDPAERDRLWHLCALAAERERAGDDVAAAVLLACAYEPTPVQAVCEALGVPTAEVDAAVDRLATEGLVSAAPTAEGPLRSVRLRGAR